MKIVKFVIKALVFVCEALTVEKVNEETHISLNLTGLIKRVICACVK